MTHKELSIVETYKFRLFNSRSDVRLLQFNKLGYTQTTPWLKAYALEASYINHQK